MEVVLKKKNVRGIQGMYKTIARQYDTGIQLIIYFSLRWETCNIIFVSEKI